MKRTFALLFAVIIMLPLIACSSNPVSDTDSDINVKEQERLELPAGTNLSSLLYQGHASIRIVSADGVVVYVDPDSGEGYDVPADIVLITHSHGDHNNPGKIKDKQPDYTMITWVEALESGKHNSFSIKGIEIESVEAYNGNHSIDYSVGYIITVDGVKIYAAGDTDKTNQMETLAAKEIDYAFFPCDGRYNMNTALAAECAELVGAKHNIPYHTMLGFDFAESIAEKFDAPNKLILHPGEEISLA